ncbi:IgG-binding virulence factor TspB family protein [Comamonas nitrativorans]|uniref:IgG-binding virulence factor TspB family protein n=1 Tax=Comamonas nitrativorans TaxID=108437 RepID=A0ABV9GWX6_9BURK
MANSFKALTLALFLFLGNTAANAGYAQAVPPKGWSTAGFNGGVAANSATYYPGGVRSSASINVGGRSVTLPASMRFASNAPRFAAAAIYLHPGLRTAAAIATWLGIAGLVYDAASGLWEISDSSSIPVSDGYSYCHRTDSALIYQSCYIKNTLIGSKYSSYSSALAGLYDLCVSTIGSTHSACRISSDGLSVENYRNGYWYPTSPTKFLDSSCPSGWYVTPAGCTQTQQPKAVTEEEFIEELTKAPMPEELPLEIPAPLPVELPEISPVFIPTGDPILNPKYNPQAEPTPENQPWIQPGVRVQPSPTPAQPWRVDLQPQNRPKSDSTPLPDVQPDSGSQNQPGTEPANPGLCDQYPDILACAKLEEPENPGPLKTIDIGGDFEILGGFAGSKVCPSFPTIDMLPGLSWQPFCDQLARIRPLVLAFAWLSAVMIILRFGRK